MAVGPGEPDVRQVSRFKVETPPVEQGKICVQAETQCLPGIVFDNDRNAVRYASLANKGVACGLPTTKGFQTLMQIMVPNESVDAEIRATQERAAEIDADVADGLILQRAVRAGIWRDERRKIFVLQGPARQ